MTLPELAGGVIVASYRGTNAPVSLVRRLDLAGVIVSGCQYRERGCADPGEPCARTADRRDRGRSRSRSIKRAVA